MKRLVFTLLATFLVVGFLGSCSTYQYSTSRIESKDFAQYKTYGWLPPVDSLSKSFYNNDIAKANILDAANDALEARGLVYSKDNPDILFRYIAIVNNKSRFVYGSMGYPGYYGYYYPWFSYRSGPVGKEAYRLGHIILEARDRKTDEIIWQARGSGEVRNPENAINNVSKVVEKVFEQYPVKAKKGR